MGAFTATAALTLGGLPAPAAAQALGGGAQGATCVSLELDNPHSGDTVPVGKYTVSGRAVDSAGAAVDRVQVFLEDRNLGGIEIGEADLSPLQGAPSLVAQSSIESSGRFTVLVDTSSTNTDVGSHTLFAYARSTSGQEVSVAVPVVLGLAGGAGGSLGSTLPSINNSAQCPPPAPPTNIVSPTGQGVVGTAAVAPPAETIRVQLDSPNPGATITQGKFQVSGRATTSTGGGVDRVQIFLGNRDLGGIELGEISTATSPISVPNTNLTSTLNANGAFNIVVTFPSQNLGVQTVFAYARSATTAKEASANTSVTISR
jgi:hypothetical protein